MTLVPERDPYTRRNLEYLEGLISAGVTGPAGPPGADGADGTNGADGADGSVWHNGTGAPAGALGVVGDYYLDDSNGDVYEKTGASTWTLRANLTGPVGDPADPLILANTQTASYVLVLSDAGKAVEMNVASANTLTIPPNSSVAFDVGTTIEVYQMGAGQTTLTPGAGVTLRERLGYLKTAGQYATVSLRKRATDEWVVSGDVTA